MPRRRKTWAEKLADARAKAAEPKRFLCEEAGQWFVVPAFSEVEALVRGVRKGRVLTIRGMTERMRERHEVDACCPMTTGIFTWILAHASADEEAAGKKRVAPWWRILKSDGSLNPRYPGGGLLQRAKLEAEGVEVVSRGKKLVVPAALAS